MRYEHSSEHAPLNAKELETSWCLLTKPMLLLLPTPWQLALSPAGGIEPSKLMGSRVARLPQLQMLFAGLRGTPPANLTGCSRLSPASVAKRRNVMMWSLIGMSWPTSRAERGLQAVSEHLQPSQPCAKDPALTGKQMHHLCTLQRRQTNQYHGLVFQPAAIQASHHTDERQFA